MTEPELRHVSCLHPGGLHRMAYWQWGRPDNPEVVVCVHGLTRQGRDFDTLARALSHRWRVVCPDVVGRGHSDWLADPTGYVLPTYVADLVTLCARLDVPRLHWVGTSMGGLIGLLLAAMPGTPIERLVLNDVGPRIEPAALARIGSYVGQPVRWASEAEARDGLWAISQGFGPHTPEQWAALCAPMLRQHGTEWILHYDPAIALPLRASTPEAQQMGEAWLWGAYDRIACPTLLLRGAESDLLSPATAQAMAARGPRARVHEVAGVGHAPMLVQADQVRVVAEFLQG